MSNIVTMEQALKIFKELPEGYRELAAKNYVENPNCDTDEI